MSSPVRQLRKMCKSRRVCRAIALGIAMANMAFAAAADALSFDFCGVGNVRVAHADGRSPGQAEGDGSLCQKSRIAIRFARADREWMRHALTWAELAVADGDFAECDRWMRIAAGFLKFHGENVDTLGDGMLLRDRLSLEYSIARAINGGRAGGVRITPADVRRWLPPVAVPGMADNLHVVRQEMFRTLLMVGAGLETWLGSHGRLPDTLRELLSDGDLRLSEADLAHGGNAVAYRHDGRFWKLKLCDVESAEEPIMDFMPAVDEVAGLQCPEIWFASTYSRKRLELFEKGFIESVDIRCRCYLKNGIVHRGTWNGQ